MVDAEKARGGACGGAWPCTQWRAVADLISGTSTWNSNGSGTVANDGAGANINSAKARAALADAAAHAAAHGHARLWRAVAEAALCAGELAAAERAFVRCSDYNVRLIYSSAVASMTKRANLRRLCDTAQAWIVWQL